jgi:hypothetical protein
MRDNSLTTARVQSSPRDPDINDQVNFYLSLKDFAALDRGYRFFRQQDWLGDKAVAIFDRCAKTHSKA